MRNLVFFMHISLDGFVAGPNGELNWLKIDEEMFDFVATMTNNADTALYGRTTYQIMESYWPKAGEQPNASKHDIEHSRWYNSVPKVVLSTTLNASELINTTVVNDNIPDRINELKQQDGKNMLIFGSPTASLSLLNLGLIDEFWFFMNPIIVGQGMSLFKKVNEKIELELAGSKTFSCGVIALHYKTKRNLKKR
jgi:dihydrofolate reductase